MSDTRGRLLEDWAMYLADAAAKGALTGKAIQLTQIETIAGPRAGALEIYAGLNSERMLRALARADAATLRQFIPWHFKGTPQCFMAGRFVRVEAGWSDELAETMVRLEALGRHPAGDGRWVLGKDELGRTVVPALNDRTPHYLVSGTSGSGKSVALRSACLQLSRDRHNRLVLVDGKSGEGLGRLGRLPGVVGPVATDGPAARAALAWAASEMRLRYEAGSHRGRVVVVFDEFQELVEERGVGELMRRLAAQGRAAGVHLVAATQHPTVDSFGDSTTRRNLSGKLALRVGDPDASRVAVGGAMPRADYLLGGGDAYAVGPGSVHRVQVAYVEQDDIDRAGVGVWDVPDWSEYDGGDIGQDLPEERGPGRPAAPFCGREIAIAQFSMERGEGRPRLVARLRQAGLPTGSDRARGLMTLVREIAEERERLEDEGDEEVTD